MKMYQDYDSDRDQAGGKPTPVNHEVGLTFFKGHAVIGCQVEGGEPREEGTWQWFPVGECYLDGYGKWRYFDLQVNATFPDFNSNGYYPEESAINCLDYMREFNGPPFGAIETTASCKPLLFKTDADEDTGEWREKDPKKWNNHDVFQWMASVAEYQKFPYECMNANAFNVDGKTLISMSKKDFFSRDEKYGPVLYSALHKSYKPHEGCGAVSGPNVLHGKCPQTSDLEKIESPFHSPQNGKVEVKLETLCTPAKIPEGLIPLPSNALKQGQAFGMLGIAGDFQNDVTDSSETYPFELDPVAIENPQSTLVDSYNSSDSYVDSDESKESERQASTDHSLASDTEQSDVEVQRKTKKNGKRSPGRPPGVKANKEKPEKKTGRLWEFIRDLLLDPQHCPSVICWENYDDGVFRFVKSEKVAKIWGDRKGNEKMNYEKLSRAMRYYYRSKVLLPVIGRRLVYKFGPTAQGWKTENPNFKNG